MWGAFGSVVGSVLLVWVAFFACLKFLDSHFGLVTQISPTKILFTFLFILYNIK
jgi:hypothetical protein